MNIKIRAALEMAKMLAFGALVAGSIALAIEFMTPTVFLYGMAIGGLTWFFYTMYTITLSRLQYEEKLKETVDSFKK